MSRIKNKNTKPELLVRSLLHKEGYRFRLHKKDLPGSPDIVLKKYKTVIFINGCLWHGHECPRGKLPDSNYEYWKTKIDANIERDKKNFEKLQSGGWQVLIIWTCELSSKEKIVDTMNNVFSMLHNIEGEETKP